jgi:hypothetical protein
MKELQGSEKQIIWAEKIRETILQMLDAKIEQLKTDKKATKNEVMRNREYYGEIKNVAEAREKYINILIEIKSSLLLKGDARWFIAYRSMDCETLVMNYCGSSKETVFPESCK